MPVFNELNLKKIQPKVSTLAGMVSITKAYRVVGGVKVTAETWTGGGGDPDPDPDPTNVRTGWLRTSLGDKLHEDRFYGRATYPGTGESKADIVTQKNAFKTSQNSNIFKYAGPHILSPGQDTVLFDMESQPPAWNSGTSYAFGAKVKYNGYCYRQRIRPSAPAGTLPTNTSYFARCNNIINGTAIQSTIPQATDIFEGEFSEVAKKRIAASALWVRLTKNDPSPTVQAERETVAGFVINQITSIMNRAGLNFQNSARYNNGVDADAPPIYEMSVMLYTFCVAFDDTLSYWSESQRSTFVNQMHYAGMFYRNMNQAYWQELYNSPNPRNGNVETYNVNATRATGSPTLRFQGKPSVYSIGKTYNNRASCCVMLWAIVGHFRKMPELYGTMPAGPNLLDEAATIAYKEQVAYGMWADGSDSEHERNGDSAPSQGLQYAAIRRGGYGLVALAAAFHGDGGALANYETSVGYLGSQDATGTNPKSHLKCALFDISLLKGELILLGSKSASRTGELYYSDFDGQVNTSTNTKIDWKGFQNNFDYPCNIIWNDPDIKEAQARDITKGYRPYAPNGKGAGGYPWWWGVFGNCPAWDMLYLGLEDHKSKFILEE